MCAAEVLNEIMLGQAGHAESFYTNTITGLTTYMGLSVYFLPHNKRVCRPVLNQVHFIKWREEASVPRFPVYFPSKNMYHNPKLCLQLNCCFAILGIGWDSLIYNIIPAVRLPKVVGKNTSGNAYNGKKNLPHLSTTLSGPFMVSLPIKQLKPITFVEEQWNSYISNYLNISTYIYLNISTYLYVCMYVSGP